MTTGMAIACLHILYYTATILFECKANYFAFIVTDFLLYIYIFVHGIKCMKVYVHESSGS